MKGDNDNRPPLEPKGIWIDGIGYVTEQPEWMGPRFQWPDDPEKPEAREPQSSK